MGKGMKQVLSVLAAVLVMASIAWATTDTYDTPASMTEIAGLPRCVTVTGTSKASAADTLVFTLPAGFDAAYVVFIDDYDATNSNKYEWFRGVADSSIIITTGSSGDRTFSVSALAGIDSDPGTVSIGADRQIASGNYLMRACR